MTYMTDTINKPMVSKSVAVGNYFYFTRHKSVRDDNDNETAVEVVGKKTDVSDSVGPLVEQEIIEFLRYAYNEYGLELLDPAPVTEDDGQKYLYGVKNKAGYETVNELVSEWRHA